MKQYTVKVTQEYVDQRDAMALAIFSKDSTRRKRSLETVTKNCDCTIHEWNMTSNAIDGATKSDVIEVDYWLGNEGVEVKFIDHCAFSSAIRQWEWKQVQSGIKWYEFCRWDVRPKRALKVGDVITYIVIKRVPFIDVMVNSKWNNGRYSYRVVEDNQGVPFYVNDRNWCIVTLPDGTVGTSKFYSERGIKSLLAGIVPKWNKTKTYLLLD
jgi:hypothetical protein